MEATKDLQDGHDVFWLDRLPKYAFINKELYDAIIEKPRYPDFLSLPIPDRKFTMAFDKRYQMYGNYKYNPATHMQVADGCWHGKCTFCVERNNKYQVRPMKSVIDELWQCHDLGFKEIFDDSGTFPDGEWLRDFCILKASDMRTKNIVMGCNMRIGADVDWDLMKFANFRMVLFGVESANQSTLNRIGKGINADDIVRTIKRAADAGLEPHIAGMVGYPWESDEDCIRTIDLFKYLLIRGYAKTAQLSFYKPQGDENISMIKQHRYINSIYHVALNPLFWYNKIKDLKSIDDFRYLIKSIGEGWIGLCQDLSGKESY
jgi:radical SAM superfamily enzyme YgiQ (UPF0313 family)